MCIISQQLTEHHVFYVVDVEDYWTCDSEMAGFILDDPSPELQLMTFYVYNVTNPQDTVQRGFKPHITQTGPYGYSKITYKYDISFEQENSDYVTYKEFSMLQELEDPTGLLPLKIHPSLHNILIIYVVFTSQYAHEFTSVWTEC
jgi:hypothetical protein